MLTGPQLAKLGVVDYAMATDVVGMLLKELSLCE